MKEVAMKLLMLAMMILAVVSGPAQASLLGASSAPKAVKLTVEEGRTLQIRWVVSTSTAHDKGAFSAQGVLKDSATSTVLKAQATPFNETSGAGPLYFEEALTITAAEAKEWLGLGYRKLDYIRQFSTGSEVPSTTEARVSIELVSKDTDLTAVASIPLVIHNLELGFKPQRFRSQISQGLPLQAQLTVHYSGQGQLTGSWQLGTVDPASGQLVFRDMGQVSKDLEQGLKAWLLSPELPTDKTGRHVLRFCSTEALGTGQAATESLCPNPQLSASLEYQVIENTLDRVASQAPATLTSSTQLSWPATGETVVYEVVLRQENGKENVTSSEFVGRLLVPAQNTSTTLSGPLLEHLKPGAVYQWQVNALDRHGDLIRQTPPARFVFMP